MQMQMTLSFILYYLVITTITMHLNSFYFSQKLDVRDCLFTPEVIFHEGQSKYRYYICEQVK